MGKFLDKWLGKFGFLDNDEDELDEYEHEMEFMKEEPQKSKRHRREDDDEFARTFSKGNTKSNVNNVVHLAQKPQAKMYVSRVTSYVSAVDELAQHYKEGKILVIDLEGASKDVFTNVRNFFGGAVFMMEGHIINMNDKTLIVTPKGIDLEGTIPQAKEELMSFNKQTPTEEFRKKISY